MAPKFRWLSPATSSRCIKFSESLPQQPFVSECAVLLKTTMDSDELQNREQSVGLTEQNDGRPPSPGRSTAVSFPTEAERRRSMIDDLNREIKQLKDERKRYGCACSSFPAGLVQSLTWEPNGVSIERKLKQRRILKNTLTSGNPRPNYRKRKRLQRHE